VLLAEQSDFPRVHRRLSAGSPPELPGSLRAFCASGQRSRLQLRGPERSEGHVCCKPELASPVTRSTKVEGGEGRA
jgi:hypothetical protein